MSKLVPGRECGECTVCCFVLPIDSDGFRKQSGTACGSCTASGCGIYASRPTACRDYFCGWRSLPMLDDGWRPDRSGILVALEYDDIPPAYPERPGIKLIVLDPARRNLGLKMLGYAAGLVDAGIPTFIALPGPPGHFFAKAFLNDRLRSAVVRRDGAAINAGLNTLLDILAEGEFEPVPMAD